MSIASDAVLQGYAGDGISTDFSYPIAYINQTDLLVTVAPAGGQPATMVLAVDYTIADVVIDAWRPNGGTIHFLVPPAPGTTILIVRRTRRDQTFVYAENDPFPAKTHELALTKITMLVQEIMCGFQGYADGPPTGGTRWDGAPYRAGDWYMARTWMLGGVTGWVYLFDRGSGTLVWAQAGTISMMSGVQ